MKEINDGNVCFLSFHKFSLKMLLLFFPCHQTSNISRTLIGNKIVDHWDVVGVPFSTAPTKSDLTSGFIGLGKDDCEAMNNRHDDPTIYMTDNICIMSQTTKMMPQILKKESTRAEHWIYKLHLTLNMFDIQTIYGHCRCLLAV